MRNKEWSVFRKTTAVILTATLVLISAGCGKGGNAAANKDYIASAVLDPAYEEASIFLDANKLMYERYMEIASDEAMSGDNAERYKALVKLYSDWDERNKLGVKPLEKYISDIQSISSISELTQYQGNTTRNPFGLGLLNPEAVSTQLQFPDKSTLKLQAPKLSLGSNSSLYRPLIQLNTFSTANHMKRWLSCI